MRLALPRLTENSAPSSKSKQPLYLAHLYLWLWELGCLPSSTTSVFLVSAGRRCLCAQRLTGALFLVFPSQAQLLLPSPTGRRETIKKKSLVNISEILVAG